MNKVILMGRLTADPEVRQTQNGTAVCRFTVAVNRKFADKQTGERQADFISCTAWTKTAEFIGKYFTKGQMICVEGSLRTGSYQDKNHSDVTHYTTDVFVDSVEFTGSKSEKTNSSPVQSMMSKADSLGIPSSLSDYEEILSNGDVPF
ncbi:MAG: single-stranded DNA-binding protein [Ruminococcus sp.]|nr:single-stranded DNA-binding protein [Ruminococcus sp.]